ncbi:MAG: POTRA domain-containing protein, partial [Alphaproteobacteria bacterium]
MNRLLGLLLALGAAVFFQASVAMAQGADPVVKRIVVEGNQRIEESTVVSYMVIKEGSAYTQAQVDQSLKTLFGTGLFADVQIQHLKLAAALLDTLLAGDLERHGLAIGFRKLSGHVTEAGDRNII